MMEIFRNPTENPIIIIEGPDGAGKTSLANELQRMLGARYLHLTYRWKEKMDVYHTAALRYAARLAKTQPVIIDRWWPSEIAYANVYRGGSKFERSVRRLDTFAYNIKAFYVICLPCDRERYVEHFNVLKGQREEMFNTNMEKVFDEYLALWRYSFNNRANAFRYDLFETYVNDDHSRELVLRNTCQKLLETCNAWRNS